MNWNINGTPFGDRDLSNVTLELANMATDRMTFEAPGLSILSPSVFTYDALIKVTRAGIPFFSGRCGRIPVHGDPKQEGHSYEILGPWDQLERLIFMQRWKSGSWEGEGDAAHYITNWSYKSRCVLGQDEEGKSVAVGSVISSIIDYAKSCGVIIQNGGIAAGPFLPWDEVTDMSCADVIRRLARWLPDAVAYFDYSTTPPTFNFRFRASISPVTIPIGSIESVNLTAVGSRSVPSVVLLYEQSNDIDGTTMLSTVKDAYPASSTGREIGAIVQTINLPGWSSSSTVQKQTIHSASIPVIGANPSVFQEWFLNHHPEWAAPGVPGVFNNVKYRDVTIDNVTRTSSLAYELIEGTLQDWMRKYILNKNGSRILNPDNKYSYEDAEDNILTTLSFKVVNEDGKIMKEVKGEVITTKIHATNCPPNTYRKVSETIDPGDKAIEGLAKSIFDNLNAPHFKGSIVIVEEEVTGTIRVGNRILISGGKPEWASMSAIVQTIQSNIDSGSTVIQVGPPSHLTTNDMIDLRRANRSRKNCIDSSSRITGINTQNSVELGSAIPKGYGASSPGTSGVPLEKVITDFRFDSATNQLQIKTREVVVDYAEPESDWTTVSGGQAEACS
jgi:hypothetical protein